ncbi:hypothetical protein F4678DRAFT_470853 [Xylaria arbuscula]|nr:hypothetical protein F4678DRAFT_470853 [Xylaria arbuscula]
MAHNSSEKALDPTFDLSWYRWWSVEQIRKQPEYLLLSLPRPRADEGIDAAIHIIWDQIRKAVLAPGPKSIDSITDMLIYYEFVDIQGSYEATLSVKDLVFAIVGFQTMLYKPYFDPSAPGGYRILDEMSGYHGTSRMSLCQSSDAGTKTLPEFLLGFGVMLPQPNYCACENEDDRQLFHQIKTTTPSDIDAHVLSRLCGVRFQWVDSLSCHLELDKQSNTLYIYRYPSFCVSCLQQQVPRNGVEECQKSSLHSCACERTGQLPWASEEDVNGLLQEILLSYRVIFAQNKRSRAIFRKLRPFASIPKQGRDQCLAKICGKKRFDCPSMPIEREEYDLAIHFPHLRNKFAQLSGYASSRKPRSVRRLWKDRRDSPAWLAYWSALIFSLVRLLLVLIQAVFQILQYVDQVQQSSNRI